MSDDLIKRDDAPKQIFASQGDDGWRWPRASKFPEQGPHENVMYVRADRIEELERERDEAMMTGHDLAKIEYRDLVGGLEAKLAKAVEIGNKMAASIMVKHYIVSVAADWEDMVAKLEGEE